MSLLSSSAPQFLARAIHEAERYGQDTWVFLRELVQNSRDAGARNIQFATRHQDNWEILSCFDDGRGMDPKDLERFLLRLYASSKESEDSSVGFYGVGFWSVLLFKPSLIRISSNQGDTTHGLEVDPTACELRPYNEPITQRGTRVTLYRPISAGGTGESFEKEVGARLKYYAQYVRPANKETTLTLTLNGQYLNTPFEEPALMPTPIRTREFDGVIGFGKTPSVRLYKGGLLVRDLVHLSEVIPSRKRKGPKLIPGLHPVIAMNIDGMKVLMDRQHIYEDPLLHKLVNVCESKLSELAKTMVKQLFPMNLKNRLLMLLSGDRIKKWLSRLGGFTLILILGFLTSWFIKSPFEKQAIPLPIGPLGPDQAMEYWTGSGIDPNRNRWQQPDWKFSFSGDGYQLFRLRTLDYDPIQEELILPNSRFLGAYAGPQEGDSNVTVRMWVSGQNNPTILPVPPGYGVVTNSVALDTFNYDVFRNQFDEPMVRNSNAGYFDYIVRPHTSQLPPARVQSTGIRWPENYLQAMLNARSLDTQTKIDALGTFLRKQIIYSRDPQIARKFQRSGNTWLKRALGSGAGDCDVINGIFMLMLRDLQIPAYLSVGFVGYEGRVQAELHAWVRYYDETWKTVDLTLNDALRLPSIPLTSLSTTTEGSAANPPLPSVNLPPFRQPATSKTFPWVPSLLILSGLLAVVALLRYRKRESESQPKIDTSNYITHLIHNHYTATETQDPLALKYRPAIALVDGKLLSIHEINQLASQGPLLGASKGHSLISHLKENTVILDRDAPGVQDLRCYLPGVVWLEDLEGILQPSSLPAFLEEAVSLIQEQVPDFRLHLTRGTILTEVALALKSPAQGYRHMFLGDQHYLMSEIKNLEMEGPFIVAQYLVYRSCFFVADADQWCTRMAKAAFAQRGRL